jgi:hypothetical protein
MKRLLGRQERKDTKASNKEMTKRQAKTKINKGAKK